MKVAGKRIVVTGAGNGIGRELTLALLEKGASVVAADIDEKGLGRTLSLAGGGSAVSAQAVDISSAESVGKFMKEASAGDRAIDGIVNCAGIVQPFKAFNDMTLGEIKRIMDVNFYGCVHMLKAFLPSLLERPEAHIVNVSSMGGFFPFPSQTIYGASKAAIKLLSEGLFAELAGTGVRVTVVFPGSVDTDIVKNSGSTVSSHMEGMRGKAKMLSPRIAAHKIVRAMERNRYQVYLGADSAALNFLSKIAPRASALALGKFMSKTLLGK
jgi:short-subunit dehydrogenase